MTIPSSLNSTATSYHLIQIDCQAHYAKPNAGNSVVVVSEQHLLNSNYLTQLPQTSTRRATQADRCTFHPPLRQHDDDVGESAAAPAAPAADI